MDFRYFHSHVVIIAEGLERGNGKGYLLSVCFKDELFRSSDLSSGPYELLIYTRSIQLRYQYDIQ